MKKGLRFQTKLMLAFLFATLLVSFAVIELTGTKVKNTYQRQFKERFDSQVKFIMEARDQRSENYLAIGKKWANSDSIIKPQYALFN